MDDTQLNTTTILIDPQNNDCICEKIKILLKNPTKPIKVDIQTTEDTETINKIKISKKTDINVTFDNFIYPDQYDEKKINELYIKAQKYYTHYITNFRSLRRVRELGLQILQKQGKNEMSCAGIKI